ncbi:MAG: methylated-DNA--[protein]-cysteine S-methyltransferase [Acidimicrobiales bacterium]
MLAVVHVPSPLGDLAVAGDAAGVTRIWLPLEGPPPATTDAPPAVRQAAAQVADYLAGCRRTLRVRYGAVRATAFQRAVWVQIATIAYGEVRTYGEIAAALRRPGAARAVGQATGANPWPIAIPCHRVVAADGPGGFGGGAALKEFLLHLEATRPAPRPAGR